MKLHAGLLNPCPSKTLPQASPRETPTDYHNPLPDKLSNQLVLLDAVHAEAVIRGLGTVLGRRHDFEINS
ncbi:MAG: hypothetical protein QXR24_05685 [Thermosphaera sp.]